MVSSLLSINAIYYGKVHLSFKNKKHPQDSMWLAKSIYETCLNNIYPPNNVIVSPLCTKITLLLT